MGREGKYWDPDVETMPRDKLARLQEERLREKVAQTYARSAYYRRKYDQAGVKPDDIKTLEDLRKLPFVLDAEYRAQPPEARLTVPLSQVKVVCSSAGTTGIPDMLPRDERDWQECLYRIARTMWSRGVRAGEMVQVLSGFECVRAGYEMCGAQTLLIHAGRGILDNQVRLAGMMKVTLIDHLYSLVPPYLERARELGVQLSVKKVGGQGEGWAASYRKKVEEKYGVTFLPAFWGMTELRVAACECEERNGYHIYSDRVLLEVIDPETREVLGPGQEGEVVATCLIYESVPVVRWRTGDIAALLPYKPCSCGRTTARLSRVHGRLVHSVKVRGKRIFPLDVEEVVGSIPGLGFEYQVVVEKPGEQDVLRLRAEHAPGVTDLRAIERTTEQALEKALGVGSKVEVVPPGSIGRMLFKAQRVVKT